MNGFSSVAEFGIIEEALKDVAPFNLLHRGWIFCHPQFAAVLFQILTISDYHSFLTATDLALDLVRFELVFSLFNSLSDPNEENDRYSIIS